MSNFLFKIVLYNIWVIFVKDCLSMIWNSDLTRNLVFYLQLYIGSSQLWNGVKVAIITRILFRDSLWESKRFCSLLGPEKKITQPSFFLQVIFFKSMDEKKKKKSSNSPVDDISQFVPSMKLLVRSQSHCLEILSYTHTHSVIPRARSKRLLKTTASCDVASHCTEKSTVEAAAVWPF